MKKFLLTSCATGLVMTVLAGNSAWAQTQSFSAASGTTVTQDSTIADNGSTPTSVSISGGGQVVLDGVNSYTGGTTVTGNSSVGIAGNDANLGAHLSTLTLGDATTAGGLVNTANSPAVTMDRNIILNAGGGQIAATGGAITLNGTVSGSGSLLVASGTVVLNNSGANTYTGTTSVINGANLIVSNDSQLGNAFIAGSTTTANTLSLGDTASSASLTIAPGATQFVSNRNVFLNAGGGIINGSTVAGDSATFNGIFAGGGELSINSGSVTLTNTSNSYTGGTLIKGGATLTVPDDTVLGGSQVTNVTLGDATTHGTLAFNNIDGTTVSSTRTFILENGGGTIATSSLGGIVSLGGIIEDDTSTGTSSKGSLTVGGTGILALTSTNTFTGDVTVLKGATLQISSDDNLGAYTLSTNSVTGQIVSTANTNTDGSLNLNTLHLAGGDLQLAANVTLQHSISTDAIGSTIDTNGFTGIVSSNISGTGDLTKAGAGVLILNGQNSYTGTTTISGGELIVGDSTHSTATLSSNVTINGNNSNDTSTGSVSTSNTVTNADGTTTTTTTITPAGNTILGGSGTINGIVTNNGGIVAPSNTLTVTSYVQGSGYLAPEITPSTTATSASELKVTGNANITGGALSVGYGAGFLRAGQYQIFTASSISGSGFTSIDAGVVPSAGLSADIVQNGDSYYVVLTQKTDLPDHPTVLPSMTQATIDQAQQTTGALLDRLASARSNALADEMAVAMTDNHRVRGSSPYGLWVQPMGGTGSRDGGDGVPGYTTQTTGFLMGADTEWMPGVAIGVALGYVNTSLDQDGSGTNGSTSTPLLAVYGGWWSGPFAIDGMAGIGMGKIDASRALNLPLAGTTTPISQVASSSHNANTKMAAVQASGYWAFDGWVVGPQLGAKFVNLRQSSYTETGTDIYNFTVASNSYNSLRPFVSGDISKRFFIGDHWALVPDVKVGFEHEVNDKAAHIDSQTQGDQALWVYNDLMPGSDIIHFLGGLKLELDRTEAFYVNYDRQQSSTGSSQLIAGGFRYRL